MEHFQKDVIGIIKAALLDEKYTLSKEFDFDKAFRFAQKHSIIVMFYYGLLNCGVDKNLPIMQNLFMITCQNVAISERQIYSLKQLFTEFEKANIDYMPVKGVLLKSLYRKPEMRSMGDTDILIKTEQYYIIESIMSSLGYSFIEESDHELIWKKSGVMVELHKRLIASHNEDFYSYFGDGWRLAKMKEGSKYLMNNEDQMIYLFTHYAKHYRATGIGLRHIIDLWVYRKNTPSLDEEYIRTELKRLKLYDFYLNTNETLDVWFEGKAETDMSDFITQVIFESGVYGTHKNYILSETLRERDKKGSAKKQKLQKIIFSLFLPYKDMCKKYPFLKVSERI